MQLNQLLPNSRFQLHNACTNANLSHYDSRDLSWQGSSRETASWSLVFQSLE